MINKNKGLLIVIDMIKGFTDDGPLKDSNIKKLGIAIRELTFKFSYKIAINDCHQTHDIEFLNYLPHCIKGSKETEFCKELEDIEFNKIFYKNCTNGFFSKGFKEYIDYHISNNFNFFVCGCCTDICIFEFCLTLKGYLNSLNKNLDIFVFADLVDTYDQKHHQREYINDLYLNVMKEKGIKIALSK